MASFWIYTTVYLLGIITGIIISRKLNLGDTYKNYISKIKGKGKSVLDVVFKPVNGETKSNKDLRQEKKLSKKQARLDKRFGK